MKLAVYALTTNAYKLALKIQMHIPEASIFAKASLTENEDHQLKEKLSTALTSQFNVYDCHWFIMSTGIAVRMIAPLIKHKSTDPAVLVSDEKGEFIISLLSGHLGGANDYSTKFSEMIGSTPVITTASDVQGKIAVDTLATQIGGYITDFQRAKELTSMILENKNIGIIAKEKYTVNLPNNLHWVNEAKNMDGYIYIDDNVGSDKTEPYASINFPHIVVGMGCRKDKPFIALYEFLKTELERIQLPIGAVKKLATVEVKKNEKGLLELASKLKVPLEIWTINDIKEVQGRFEGSQFVESQIGVTSVAEPVAYLSSDAGKQLTGKIKENGMTLSIWEDNNE